MRGYRLDVGSVVLYTDYEPAEFHSPTRKVTLNVLRELAASLQAASGAVVTLRGRYADWDWPVDTLPTLLTELSQLPQLRFNVTVPGALTDSRLSTLLACGTVARLTVASLELQSDQHANTPWPWDKLTVYARETDITHLAQLPDPTKRQARPEVAFLGCLVISHPTIGNQVRTCCSCMSLA